MGNKANYRLADYFLHVFSTSVGGSPQVSYVTVPMDGDLIESMVVPYAAITAADSTITLALLPQGVVGSAVAIGTTLVIPVATAAIGLRATAKHTAPRRVSAGDVIRLTPAGASTTAAAMYTLRIRR
jgi:hypothetical protein